MDWTQVIPTYKGPLQQQLFDSLTLTMRDRYCEVNYIQGYYGHQFHIFMKKM